MKKKFWNVQNVVMGSFITLLGFTCCRTNHKMDSAEVVYGPPPGYEEELRRRAEAEAEAERQAQLQQEQERIKREKEIKVVYGPPPSPYRNAKPDEDGIYDVVEEMPRFMEGAPEEWVAERVKLPVDARRRHIEGHVMVNFVVKPDGSVDGVTVLRSTNSKLDAEAVRVVKSMPKWEPGRQRGAYVPVRYTLPVEFRLK